jgi:putative Ca2+/H+ antiporter (TMEM165/GDT1 family)
MFGIFLRLGIHHILNISAYDHMLFVTLLTMGYKPRQWRIVLALVTAFTLGHSVSLAVCALGYFHMDRDLIEWLIVITILITAVETLIMGEEKETRAFTMKYWLKYGLIMLFGLIHGLGFASTLVSLMGKETHLAIPLVSFNLGVELGQWVVIFMIMGFSFVVMHFFKLRAKILNRAISLAGIVISIVLLIIRFPWK